MRDHKLRTTLLLALRSTLRFARHLAAASIMLAVTHAAVAADGVARRKVIIDQDAFGPGGSNMQDRKSVV